MEPDNRIGNSGPLTGRGSGKRRLMLLCILAAAWAACAAYFFVKVGRVPWTKSWESRKRVGGQSVINPALMSTPLPEVGHFPKMDGFEAVDFGTLGSFPVDEPAPWENTNPYQDDTNRGDPFAHRAKKKGFPIPASIQALDGRKVEIAGFMIPLLIENDRVTTFILAQSQMTCCFGIAPKLNQWIYVTMAPGRTTEWMMDTPLFVCGTLNVGRHYEKQDELWSLYRIAADKVMAPSHPWF